MELLGTAIGLFILYIFVRRDIHGIKPTKNKPVKKPKGAGVEHVYVLANPSYINGRFKIGLTTREVSTRMSELDTTGVPTPFQQVLVLKTDDCKAMESRLHKQFSNRRVRSRREFFDMTESDMKLLLRENSDNILWFDHQALSEALGVDESNFKRLM